MLEYALLVVAVTSALALMSDYVRRSLNGFSRALQQELIGAEDNNRPDNADGPNGGNPDNGGPGVGVF